MECILDKDGKRSIERRNDEAADNDGPQTNKNAWLLQQLEEGECASRFETFESAILIRSGAVR